MPILSQTAGCQVSSLDAEIKSDFLLKLSNDMLNCEKDDKSVVYLKHFLSCLSCLTCVVVKLNKMLQQ